MVVERKVVAVQMVFSIVFGIVLGTAVLFVLWDKPAAASWTAIVLGAAGAAMIVGGLVPGGLDFGRAGALFAGTLPAVGLILAIGALVRGERRVINWVALALPALPLAFWLAFFVGELMYPH